MPRCGADDREPAPGGHRPSVRGGLGEGRPQNGHGRGCGEGGARTLREAGGEQGPRSRGEQRGEGRGGEHEQPGGEGATPAEAVGDAAAEEEEPGEGQPVGGAEKDQVGAVEGEVVAYPGQRYDERGEREEQRHLDDAEQCEGGAGRGPGRGGLGRAVPGLCSGHFSPDT